MDLSQTHSEKFMSVRDAAEHAHYTTSYISRLCRNGDVTCVRLGKSWEVNEKSLDSFIETNALRKEQRRAEIARERKKEYYTSVQDAPAGAQTTADDVSSRSLPAVITATRAPAVVSPLSRQLFAGALSLIIVLSGAAIADSGVVNSAALALNGPVQESASGMHTLTASALSAFTNKVVSVQHAQTLVQETARRRVASGSYAVAVQTANTMSAFERAVGITPQMLGQGSSHAAASAAFAPEPLITPISQWTHGLQTAVARVTPKSVVGAVASAYVVSGQTVYMAIQQSLDAYRQTLINSGAPALSFGATVRDAFVGGTNMLAQAPIMLGNGIVGATHAVIGADVALVRGWVHYTPKVALATTQALVAVGGSVQQTVGHVAMAAPHAYIGSIYALSNAAPRVAAAGFAAEYAVGNGLYQLSRHVMTAHVKFVQSSGTALADAYVAAQNAPTQATHALAAALAASAKPHTVNNTSDNTGALDTAAVAFSQVSNIGTNILSFTYDAVAGLVARSSHTIAAFFSLHSTTPTTGEQPPVAAPMQDPLPAAAVSVPTTTPKAPPASPPPIKSPVKSRGAPQHPITARPISENIIRNTTIKGVSSDYVNIALANLRASLLQDMQQKLQPIQHQQAVTIQSVQEVNMIQNLTGLTVHDGKFDNSAITNSSFSGSSVSADSASFKKLTIASGGTTSFLGNTSLGGGAFFVDATSSRVGIGTTSPSDTLAVNGPIYLASTAPTSTANRLYNQNGSLYFNGSLVGSGVGGGSGGGTWATTTSSVAGELVNYPQSNSDIIAIGGNSTSSAPFWFNPNNTTSYLGGNVGVGTTSPTHNFEVVGNTQFDLPLSTDKVILHRSDLSLNDATFSISGNNSGTFNVGIGGTTMLAISNSHINIGGPDLTIGHAEKGVITLGNNQYIGAYNAAGTNDYYIAGIDSNNKLQLGADQMTIDPATGNVGIGTTSPYARLSVAGNVVASSFNATSTTATSTFAGNVNIGSGKEYRINGQPFAGSNGTYMFVGTGNTINTTASGIALGLKNVSTNTLSSAVGQTNTATGVLSSAFGASNKATAVAASAFGSLNNVSGTYSNAFGNGNTVSASSANAIGAGIKNAISNSLMIGPSNTAKATILNTGEFQAPFFTATSTTATSTFNGGFVLNNNAFTYNPSSGYIGIGTKNPTSPLYITGTNNPLVTISTGGVTNLALNGTNVGIQFNVTGHDGWRFSSSGGVFTLRDNTAGTNVFQFADGAPTNSMYVKNTGNVGFGTSTPGSKLSVSGNATIGADLTSAAPANSLQVEGNVLAGTAPITGSVPSTGVVSVNTGINFNNVQAPSTPTATLVASAGNVDAGAHRYRISYYTANGETSTSNYSNTVNTSAADGQVTITLPVSTDPRVIGRKIYRTKATNSYYTYLVATVANNTQTSYTDNTSDAALGSAEGTERENTTANNLYVNGAPALMLGANSLYFGQGAGNSTSGGQNTFIGGKAGNTNTTGTYSTYIGTAAGYGMTTGGYNTAVGYQSMDVGPAGTGSGSGNVAYGTRSLRYLTTGSSNNALGANAMTYITTGSYNVTNGNAALEYNTTGAGNAAIGFSALQGSSGSSDLSYNTVVGAYAGQNALTGANYNTLVGYRAGHDITTGANNTLIGPQTGTGIGVTTGSDNILIGDNVHYGLSQTGNFQLNIGNLIFGTNLASSATLSSGSIGIGTSSPTATLSVNAPAGKPSFIVGSSTATSFIINKNGSVGVGTDNPTYDFQVTGPSGSGQQGLFGVKDTSGNVKFAINQYGNFIANNGGYFTGVAGALPQAGAVAVTASSNGITVQNSGTNNLNYNAFQALGSLDNYLWEITKTGREGIGTTTPGTVLSIGTNNGINISDTATSTFGHGINIKSGCFSVNGTCISGGGGGSSTYLGLTDTPSSYTAQAIPFVSGSALSQSSDLTFDGKRVSIGAVNSYGGGGYRMTVRNYQAGAAGAMGAIDAEVTGGVSSGINTGVNVAVTAQNGTNRGLYVSATGGATNYAAIFANGNVGIGTTTPSSTLTVQGSGCFSIGPGATLSCGTTAGNIYYTTANPGNYDVAERYKTYDRTITKGDVIAFDPKHPLAVEKATSDAASFIGVVSTAPGVLLGGSDPHAASTTVPVALTGHVPVKVSLANGPIAIGDRLTVSSTTPGVAVKLIGSGSYFGQAIQPYTHTTKSGEVVAFINPGVYYANLSVATSSVTTTNTTAGSYDLATLLGKIGATFTNGVLHISKLATDTLAAVNVFADHFTAANATIGTASHPTGVTLYDSVTKKPYCLSVANGVPTTTPGACGTVSTSVSPFGSQQAGTTTQQQAASSTPTTGALAISLIGNSLVHVSIGGTYVEQGATVTGGSEHGASQYQIYVNGDMQATSSPWINTSKAGTYILTYTVTDSVGDRATTRRTIDVSSTVSATAPTSSSSTTTATSTAPSTSATSTSTPVVAQPPATSASTSPAATSTSQTGNTSSSGTVATSSTPTPPATTTSTSTATSTAS